MSHFYGSMQGARGEVTRCGSKLSGIHGHLRGWTLGVEVCAYFHGITSPTETDAEDRVRVVLTGGSNGRGPDLEIFDGNKSDLLALATISGADTFEDTDTHQFTSLSAANTAIRILRSVIKKEAKK